MTEPNAINPYNLQLFNEWLDTKYSDLVYGTRRNYKESARRFILQDPKPDVTAHADYNNFLIDKTRGKENDPRVQADPTYKARQNLEYMYYGLKKYVEYLKVIKIIDKIKADELMDRFPRPIKKENTKREKRTSQPELVKVLECVKNPKNLLVGLIMLHTGKRIGTILGIKRTDVDPRYNDDQPHIAIRVVEKQSKADIIFIYDPYTIELFKRYFATEPLDHGYLFLETTKWAGKDKVAEPKDMFTSNEDCLEIRDLQRVEAKLDLKDSERRVGKKLYLKAMLRENKNLQRKDILAELEDLIWEGALILHIAEAQIKNLWRFKHLNYLMFDRDLKLAAEAAGLKYKGITPHTFRRAYAARVWHESGKDIKMVKDALNHTNIETTLKYIKHEGLERKELDRRLQIGLE